jgi:hypothetical protein
MRGRSPLRGLKGVVVATVNGKAYYVLSSLLHTIGIKFESLLPWDPSVRRASLLLTTKEEVPDGFEGKVLLYEELTGEEVHDRAKVISKFKGGDIVLVGVDPGKHIGVACIYGGFLLWEEAFTEFDKAVKAIIRLLSLPARYHIIRIGDGRPEIAERLASALSPHIAKDDFIEIVNERGTSVGRKKRSEKDVKAAYRIAVRKGKEWMKG